MDLQKINVKFFAAGSGAVRLTDFIDIFNSWIQSSEGEYYDVADYSHMQAGPGIVLVTHEATTRAIVLGFSTIESSRFAPATTKNLSLFLRLPWSFAAGLNRNRRLKEKYGFKDRRRFFW